MNLTVAIVCSSDELLERCLASIDEPVAVVIVLNHPTKEVERIANAYPGAKILRHDERNLGLLRQLAADNAVTKSICYIDSDCEFTPGTLRAVDDALKHYSAVSIPLRYRSVGLTSSIVSRCRSFTTPDQALLIPAAFRLDVQRSIGGYLYDRRLVWGEDSDPASRLRKAGISFGVSGGLVWHQALTMRADAASARRLGRGRRVQEKAIGIPSRFLWRDIVAPRELALAWKCARQEGWVAAAYHLLVWRPSYKYGYWRQRVLER